MKKGISLIVLIITIIVVVILAGAIVLNLSNTNIIEEANKAVINNNLKSNEEAFELYKANMFVDNKGELDFNNFSILDENIVYDTNGDGDVTENISKPLSEIFPKPEIIESIDENGKLIQSGSIEPEETVTFLTIVVNSPTVATEHSTIDGNKATSTNPVIPRGFKPVNAVNNAGSVVADWNDLANNYNKGLVIQDTSGNQFVWIPVDELGNPGDKISGKVTYNKWCMDYRDYDDSNISNDILPSEVTAETTQITTYGGFYVARYEAGKEATNTLVSKDDAIVWNNINYTDSKSIAENMYNDSSLYGVRSGFLTGKMWDTMLDYLYEHHGKTESKLDDNSKSWGNYSDSSFPANVSGYGSLQVTGYSDCWQAGNIYDIAGNTFEWINETRSTDYIIRGGTYFLGGDRSSGCRDNISNICHDMIAFRPALFIQPE